MTSGRHHLVDLVRRQAYKEIVETLEADSYAPINKLSKENYLSSLNTLLSAYIKTKKIPSREVLENMAKKSIESGELTSLEIINEESKKHIREDERILFFITVAKTLLDSGFVKESDRYSSMGLANLARWKRYELGTQFTEEMIGKRGETQSLKSYQIKFLFLKGELDKIEKSFREDLKAYEQKKHNSKRNTLKKFAKIYQEQKAAGEKVPQISWALTKSLMFSFRDGSKDIGLRKTFINTVYEDLLEKRDSIEIILEVCRYAVIFKRKSLATNTSLYLQSYIKNLSKRNQELAHKLAEEASSLENEKEQSIGESIDIGADLLNEAKRRPKGFSEIKTLERDIKFLKKAGEKEQALEQMKKLRDIDPENELLAELYEFERQNEGTRQVSVGGDTDTVMSDLLKEIEKHTSQTKERDDDRSEMGLKKLLEVFQDEEFLEKAKDLYVIAYQLQFFELCDGIVKRALNLIDPEDIRTYVGFNYLRIEECIAREKYHEAIDVCMKLLQEIPLSEDERIDILYLSAECLLRMKNWEEAYKIYKNIEKTSPNYRLVRQRLARIEKH